MYKVIDITPSGEYIAANGFKYAVWRVIRRVRRVNTLIDKYINLKLKTLKTKINGLYK